MNQAVAPKRRRFLLVALGGASAVALGTQGCAAAIFPFIPDHYTFSQAQVQDAVQRKFPLQRTASQIFDVMLSNPLVGLSPDRNRVTIRLDARLATPFMPNPVTGVFYSFQSACLRCPKSFGHPDVAECRRCPGFRRCCAIYPADQRGRRGHGDAVPGPLPNLHIQARTITVCRC